MDLNVAELGLFIAYNGHMEGLHTELGTTMARLDALVKEGNESAKILIENGHAITPNLNILRYHSRNLTRIRAEIKDIHIKIGRLHQQQGEVKELYFAQLIAAPELLVDSVSAAQVLLTDVYHGTNWKGSAVIPREQQDEIKVVLMGNNGIPADRIRIRIRILNPDLNFTELR